jgi:transposase
MLQQIAELRKSPRQNPQPFRSPDYNSGEWKKIDQQLPTDHHARLISTLVEQLNLDALLQSYQHAKRPPYDPKTLLKIVLYEHQQGNLSPAQWHRDTKESLPVQWILGGLKPGRSTLYDFQQRFDPIIDQLNAKLLEHHFSREDKANKNGSAAIDGTFVAANTSRHRLLNKSRLLERILLLEQNLADIKTETPRWLARSERGKRLQLLRYRKTLNNLEKRLEQNAKLPPYRQKPEKKVLISPTDSEAPLGLDKLKTYRPLYNVQMARCTNSDWILGYDVLPTNTDIGTLNGTFERCRKLSGSVPKRVLTDAIYASERDLIVCEQAGVTLYAPYRENTLVKSSDKKSKKQYYKKEVFQWDAERQEYRCPNGSPLVRRSQEYRHVSDDVRLRIFRYACLPELCLACPLSSECTPNPAKGRSIRRSEREDLVESLRERMSDAESKILYRSRSSSIERCFGELKLHRGLVRFSRRGLRGAQTTVGLAVLLHNGLLWLKEKTRAENAPKTNPPPPDS